MLKKTAISMALLVNAVFNFTGGISVIQGFSICLAFSVSPLPCFGWDVSDGVLYWQVNDSATVDGGSIMDFVDSYGIYEEEYEGETYVGYNVAARVAVSGGDLNRPYYLPVYYGVGTFVNGESGVEFSPDVGGYWGSGVPTGNQSPFYGLNDSIFMEYAFQVELGELTWDDVADSLDWTTIARSDVFAAASLNEYIHERFDLYPSNLQIWTPLEFYTVPEPSSGILYALGLSLLSLGRKRTTIRPGSAI